MRRVFIPIRQMYYFKEKNMKRINSLLYMGLMGIVLLSSCDAQLDQVNPNAATEETFWQNEADFEKALVSCYTPLKNALNGGYYGTRGVMMRIARADEVEFRNDISEVYQACYFTNSNGNSLSQGMFYQFYNALYRTNSILQRLEEKQEILSADFIDKVKGECLFIRGFYLFQLAKEFKDVPLRLTASQSPSTFPLAKSTQQEVWNQALVDLDAAASFLPIQPTGKGKPSKGAAYATMGKIYLYMEEYDKAIKVLEPLTHSPYTYKLVDFAWNFDEAHENNEESIFELLIDQVGGTDVWGDGENINSTQTNSRPVEYAAEEVGGWFEAQPTQQMMDIFLKERDKDGNYRENASISDIKKVNSFQNKFLHEILIPSCHQSFSSYRYFLFIPLKHGSNHFRYNRIVYSRVHFLFTVIFPEFHIKHPVKSIFHLPVIPLMHNQTCGIFS